MTQTREPCKCDVYSRVVGYFRPVNNWNKGKRQEYDERKAFIVESVKKSQQSLAGWGSSVAQCLLITTQTCPNCSMAKQMLTDTTKLPLAIIDASTDEGFEIAKKYGVSSVPTAVFIDKNDELITKEFGIEKIQSYIAEL